MLKESEMTIREHCDSIRHEVDIARETALENIHKASNTLMTEIEEYERECLSSWTAAKVTVADVSKRMRAFLAEQQEHLQSVKVTNDDEFALHLDEADKLAQELNERKKELKATMFNDNLASFHAFPSTDDASLGELTFKSVQLPFKTLDLKSTEIKQVDILTDYDFLLPLNSVYGIVTFKWSYDVAMLRPFSQIKSFDWQGRLIGSSDNHAERLYVIFGTAAQCGPNEFVLASGPDHPELYVFNSSVECLRDTRSWSFKSICCNSKFVFGLWDTSDAYNEDYQSYDSDDDDDSGEREEEEHSSRRIQAHHLDTLNEAFELRMPARFTMKRIMSDEHRVVAMSRLGDEPDESCQWFVSIFDLQARAKKGDKAERRKFFLVERHIDLMLTQPLLMLSVFVLDRWLVVPRQNELVWFDKKEGKRSETITVLNNTNELRATFLSGSSLLFVVLAIVNTVLHQR